MAKKTYLIIGKVVDRKSDTGIQGLRVEAWDADLIFDDRLGKAVTDEDGTFEIKFDRSMFKEIFLDRHPDLFFKVFREGRLIRDTRDSVWWNVKEEETEVVIGLDFPEGHDETKQFFLQGKVLCRGRAGVGGLRVEIVDKNIGDYRTVGETVTDERGGYSLSFIISDLQEKGKQHPDFQARVFSGGSLLGASEVRYNAANRESLNVVLSEEASTKLPSEFETLTSALSLHYKGKLADIQDEKEIIYLAGKIGAYPVHIHNLVAAHQFHKETGLDPELLYGLFREGIPAKLTELLCQSHHAIKRAIMSACKKNMISDLFADELDKVLKHFKQIAVKSALKHEGLMQLVGSVIKNTEDQHEFVRAYILHNGPIEKFWHSLPHKFPKEDLQFTFQVAELTQNHLPLIQFLQNARKDVAIEIGKNKKVLFKKLPDLAHLSEDDWRQIITRKFQTAVIGCPVGVAGDTQTDQNRQYARSLAQKVEDAFPMDFLFYRLREDDLPGKEDLQKFFEKNRDYDIRSTRIEEYLELKNLQIKEKVKLQIKALSRLYKLTPRYTHVTEMLKANVDSAHQISLLGKKAFVRKFGKTFGVASEAEKIYARARRAQAMALGLTSMVSPLFNRVMPKAIPNGSKTKSKEKQINQMPDWQTLFGSVDFCECEHCRSLYSPAAYQTDILNFLRGRDAKSSSSSAKDVLFKRRPDLGDIELSCENTNISVPYVDLVNEVLETAVLPFERFKPFDLPISILDDLNKGRIKDLRDQFTPKLAAEAVITSMTLGESQLKGQQWWTIDDNAFTYVICKDGEKLHVTSRSRQTKGTAAERAAIPQYINEDAYEKLRQPRSVYPWSLPFDLRLEETRDYLNHLGVPRYRIMEAFSPSDRKDTLNSLPIALEYLGLSSIEASIITGKIFVNSEPPDIWNLWGFEKESLSSADSIPDPADSTKQVVSGRWRDVVKGRVDIALQQSGLAYKELYQLLDTYFINPESDRGRVRVVSKEKTTQEPCQLNNSELTLFDETTAVKTVRFVRLWRKLGWSMSELDQAITAFRPPDFGRKPYQRNEKFLIQLSHVQRLKNEFNLPVTDLLAFWADIDSARYTDYMVEGRPRILSLYDHLFRNRTIVNPLDEDFPNDPAIIQESNKSLDEKLDIIASALRLGISRPRTSDERTLGA